MPSQVARLGDAINGKTIAAVESLDAGPMFPRPDLNPNTIATLRIIFTDHTDLIIGTESDIEKDSVLKFAQHVQKDI